MCDDPRTVVREFFFIYEIAFHHVQWFASGGAWSLTITWVKRMKASISNVYDGLSFKQQIGIVFLSLIALAIAVVGTASYLIASKELERNAFSSSRESVSKTTQLLDDKLYSVSKSVRSIMLSDSFNLMMQDVQSNNISNYYVHLSEMQYQFSQAMFNEPLIESILIATPIGDFYHLSQRRSPNLSFYESNLYYLSKDNNEGLWLRGHNDVFFTGESRVLSFVTKGTQDYFSNTNVYFIVNISERGLIDIMNQGSSQKEGSYFIIDTTGNEVMRTTWSVQHNTRKDEPFLSNVTEEVRSASFFHTFDETEYLVNYSRSSVVDYWLLFGIQSKDKLLEQLKNVQQATICLMLVFLLAAWFVSSRLTGVLVRPLYRLQRLMREVEDNRLTVRFESTSRDEVAQVGFQFNRMLDEINRLIQDVRTSEAGKREAEMRALTAQMEPHFLYNTLNTIYCKSEMGENEDVNQMILALSRMFQLGLSGGKDWNTLEDELTHVEQYCAIQGMCYEGLFRYEAEVSDRELLTYYVPKILLQPIVENSIQHGLRDRRDGGEIRLAVNQKGDKLHIAIQDNGSGVDLQLVSERMKQPSHSPSGKGFALYNITNRLSLFYGDEARMEISCPAVGGTRTELWIPMRRGEIQWYA